ncbi:hypothetical protein [Kitasatospora sp. NPDC001132]
MRPRRREPEWVRGARGALASAGLVTAAVVAAAVLVLLLRRPARAP